MSISEILAAISALAGSISSPAIQALGGDLHGVLVKHASANDVSIDDLKRQSAAILDPPAPKETP